MTTRNTLAVAALLAMALSAGWWGRGMYGARELPAEPSPPSAQGPCPGGALPLYWKAPMDPTYVRDEPGKSPMGMDLVPECPGAPGAADPEAVVIDAATIQNIGVRTTPVERRDLTRRVRAVGRVAVDERRVAHVHTKVQGWVERLFVDFVGQQVERGQPLLEIYSPELVATQEELLLAARYREATERSPFEDVRGGGESLFEATKRRLALWDVSDRDVTRLLEKGQVERTLTLHAPASGIITELGVRSGMEVSPNANLYTIADLSRVWIIAEVYEYELPWLELGQKARVELRYRPGRPMEGELTYIAPFLDPQTRTAEVRLELDNEARELKPEMFGTAWIEGSTRLGAVAIPTEAVIRSGTRDVVVVALGEGRFEPREVTLGLDPGDGWLEVSSGLNAGEEVVVSSQFLIDSESNLQEAVRKLLSAKAEGANDNHAAHVPAASSGAAGASMASEHDHSSMGHDRAAQPTDGGDPAMEHDHSSMGHDRAAQPPDGGDPAMEHDHSAMERE